MSRTWLFQANPKRFRIDEYLATFPPQCTWLITRYRDEISIGDQVFIWRAAGEDGEELSGVIAEATVLEPAQARTDDPNTAPYWHDPAERLVIRDRALLRLNRVASKKEVIKRAWLREDPILRDLTILKMASGTNYAVPEDQGVRLNALWCKTGHDFTWSESVAGLWAYSRTLGGEVSKKAGSPVVTVALKTGRAVTGIYNKVMNFRALDERDQRAGMSAGSVMDQRVWERFYDPTNRELREAELQTEYDRFWGESAEVPADEADAIAQSAEEQAGRLLDVPLADLMKRYTAREKNDRAPRTRPTRTRAYERDPYVVAIAKLRAAFKCELPGCSSPPFEGDDGRPYCEVHHLTRLADGGPDVLENVVCLCPNHHREAHHGKNSVAVTLLLQTMKASSETKLPRALPEGRAQG